MLKKNRIEKDFIGSVSLPDEALYGVNTYRTVKNLSFSGKRLSCYPTYIKALAAVKKAAASANVEAGVLSEEFADAIAAACDDLLEGHHREQFVVDMLHGGGGIGVNMNINEVIANLANVKLGESVGSYAVVHPIDHVNASQSTSDVCHTAGRISLIASCEKLKDELTAAIAVIDRKTAAFQEITTIARTCLQDGMQIKLGQTFSGYASMLTRRLGSLDEALEQIYQINLGGTVIGCGNGAPAAYRETVVEKLQEITRLPLSLRENLFDAAQNFDDLAHISTQLRLLASCLIKLAKDLRLLSSGPEAGFAEITLPAVQAGSSFFPGKVNPVIPETLIQCCFQVIGADQTVQMALEHGELQLNVFEGVAVTNLLDAMSMLEKGLHTFRVNCLSGIEANQERCEHLANSTIPLVVKLKDEIGYSAVAAIIKENGIKTVKRYVDGGDTCDKHR